MKVLKTFPSKLEAKHGHFFRSLLPFSSVFIHRMNFCPIYGFSLVSNTWARVKELINPKKNQ